MKLVIFGLTISSSWGNGHATLWRGLWRALARRGHRLLFFERDSPWYAAQRDLEELPGGELVLYPDWDAVASLARRHLQEADAGLVTSYCPDGRPASRLLLDSPVRHKLFYDLDTPVTMELLAAGREVPWLPPEGLGGFDLVLSFTGGPALRLLATRLGARRVAPLYGHVDPQAHRPVEPLAEWRSDLSWLGTWAADRQEALEALLVEPARREPRRRFLIGGALYPRQFPWTPNIWFVHHLPPARHPQFFCSSRLTLNVTRRVMADMGWCPSGRLFEAAACGAPLLSDRWEGLESFYEPGREILTASGPAGTVAALERSDEELARLARAARERTLEQHTSERRAVELERLLGGAGTPGED